MSFLRYILLAFLFIFFKSGEAQFYGEIQEQLDSLSLLLSSDEHDTTKANVYVELSEILYVTHLDTVRPLCEKSREIAQNNLLKESLNPQEIRAFQTVLARALNNIGYSYVREDVRKALNYYEQSLEIVEKLGNKKEIANTLNNIGVRYKKMGLAPKALTYYHRSLKIQEEIGDQKGIARCLNNIGALNETEGNLDEALEYYHKSRKIKEKINDRVGTALTLSNIGVIHRQKNELAQAFGFFIESLNIQEEIGDRKGLARSMANIGGTYREQGNYVDALKYFNKSLALRTEINDKEGVASCSNNIGRTEMQMGNFRKAVLFGEKGLAIAEKIDHLLIAKESAELLSEAYKNLHQYKKGLEMYQLAMAKKDSLNNEKKTKELANQLAKYGYEKQALADSLENAKIQELKDLQIAEQEATIQQEQTVKYSLFGGISLLILLSVVILNGYREKKKANLQLEEQKHLVEEQNKEITDSITYAKRIQTAILPPRSILNKHLKNGFVFYRPKDIIAGDFYWLEATDDLIMYAVADCTGHGVPGAMVSVICHNALNRAVREYALTDPAAILGKVREMVIETFEKSKEEVKDGMDIALCVLNFKTNVLEYAGANNPLYVIRKGELIETKADKQPIGKYAITKEFTTHSIKMEEGDSIYTFTDGFPDQFGGPKGKKFMYKPFKRLLLSFQDKTMDEQGEILEKEFVAWQGDLEQIDDVCVIGLKV